LLSEANDEGEATCFVYQKDDSDYILFPFLKRKINNLSLFSHLRETYYDIVSPYGYGGYLRSDECTTPIDDFLKAFHRYCQEQHIVSEFVRFHPWLKTQEGCDTEMTINLYNQVVAIDTAKTAEEIWSDFDRKCRNRIRKSAKEGVTIEMDNSPEAIDVFLPLYNETMSRNEATGYYYFSKDYFRNMVKLLDGNITFFHARLDNKIIASILVITGGAFANAHLAGTNTAYLHLSPMMALFHEASVWAGKQGYRYFILGGGRSSSPDDSLLRMKTKFAKETTSFHTGKKIHLPDVYKELSHLKKIHIQQNKLDILHTEYFPEYRNIRFHSPTYSSAL
jgi:lipid II:glycine glycyltransferase (peptidoglycan interpeptide bridge formation enzyme)